MKQNAGSQDQGTTRITLQNSLIRFLAVKNYFLVPFEHFTIIMFYVDSGALPSLFDKSVARHLFACR